MSDGASAATTGATDTARDGPPYSKRTTTSKRGRKRSLYKRRRNKRKWTSSVSLSVNTKKPKHKGKGKGGGQFVSSGGGGSSSVTVEPEKEQTQVEQPKDTEHDVPQGKIKRAYHWLHEKGHAGFEKLPKPVQSVVSAVVAVAFSGWTASQKIAERIAIEKWQTPQQAAKTRSVLAASDIVAFKPLAIATAGLGAGIAAATWVVPPVTACYLVHSAARHPVATYRAAKGIIGDILAGVKKHIDEHTQVLSIDVEPV